MDFLRNAKINQARHMPENRYKYTSLLSQQKPDSDTFSLICLLLPSFSLSLWCW